MAKKPTMKEMKERVDMLTQNLNFVSRMLESVGIAFSNYVQFKGEEEEFKKYLENNKNLHKLSKEKNEKRESGHNKQDNDLPAKKVRKESNGKTKN